MSKETEKIRRKEINKTVASFVATINRLIRKKSINIFEFGRAGDPNTRLIAKRYDHMTFFPIPLSSMEAKIAEQDLIDAYGHHPLYHPKAGKGAGGGSPANDAQWVYLLWNGNCSECCSLAEEHNNKAEEHNNKQVPNNNLINKKRKINPIEIFNKKSRTWKEFLINVVEYISENHKKEFDKILNVEGTRGRIFISRNPRKLNNPIEIKDTGIYIETKLSAEEIINLCHLVVEEFGYDETSLDMICLSECKEEIPYIYEHTPIDILPGSIITSFNFDGNKYNVSTWKDLLLQVIYCIYNDHKKNLTKF